MTYCATTKTEAVDELKILGYSEQRAETIIKRVLHDGSWSATVAGLPVRVDRRGRTYEITY